MALSILLISGCATTDIDDEFTVRQRIPLDIPAPAPVTIPAVKWTVVTPENVKQAFKALEDANEGLVLFALTPREYEKLAISNAELRNFINTQRIILNSYKEYYEGDEIDEIDDID